MRIAIDCRVLQEPAGGVSEYAAQTISHMVRLGSAYTFVLVTTGAKKPKDMIAIDGTTVEHVHIPVPNKLLHGSICLSGFPRFDALVSRYARPCDLFFFPNIGFITLSRGARCVLTVHDLSFILLPDVYAQKQRLWHSLVRPGALFMRASRCICVSQKTADDLVRVAGVPPHKVSVVPLGVDLFYASTPTHTREQLCLPQTYVLALGLDHRRKNCELLLAAWTRLLQTRPRPGMIHLVLVSSGDPLQHERMIRARYPDCSSSVSIRGPLTKSILRSYYAHATSFVYPSLYEGFGFPPFEAALSHTAVIASSAGSLPETIGDGALLISPYNVSSLVCALRRILDDAAFRKRLEARAYARAAQYTWEKNARTTLELLEQT